MFKRFFILLILLVGIVETSQSQVRKVKISSIVVEGNDKSEPSTIRLNSGLIVGKEIAGEDIQQALKNLWSLKLFSDIKILAANQTTTGIDLIIRVEEYPRLRKVDILGHEEIDVDEIENEISVYRGMVVTPYKLFKIKKNIKNLYVKEGFLLVDIEVDTVVVEPGFVNVSINIDEGEEVQIEQITFHGNEAFDDDDLKGSMEETSEGGFFSSADFNEKLYKIDLDKVVMYCKENGYRDAEIITDSVSYSEDGKNIFIDIWIEEGPKYYFGDIQFTGQSIFNTFELQAELDIQRGDIYDQVKYNERISEGLQKMYYNQGYLFAQVQPLETPVGNDTLDINFNITEGHVVSVKEINIIGNTKTHEKVIRREFRLQPGDVFNSQN